MMNAAVFKRTSLAMMMALALAACGQKEENKTDDQTNDPAITDQDNAADEKVTLPVADGAVIEPKMMLGENGKEVRP